MFLSLDVATDLVWLQQGLSYILLSIPFQISPAEKQMDYVTSFPWGLWVSLTNNKDYFEASN